MRNNTLKRFRESKGLSQEKLARVLDITLATYAKTEKGKRRASRGFIDRMIAAFPEDNVLPLFFSMHDDKQGA